MKKILLIISLSLFLASCWEKENISENSLKISKDWVEIKSENKNLSISKDWIKLASLIFSENKNISAEEKSQFANLESENLEIDNCKAQFDQIVKNFWNNYDTCFAKRQKIPSCDANVKTPKVNLAIVFDSSGSMAKKIWNESMIDIAKDELKKYVSDLDKEIWWAFFVYWHKWNWDYSGKQASCSGIENIWEFKDWKEKLVEQIWKLSPNWWTPIDFSLQKAKKYLDKISEKDDQKIILLISDWKETCDWKPLETAKNIASSKNTYIDVIWFNVFWETENELFNIAKAGWWKYTNVKSRSDFVKVFASMKAFSKETQCSVSGASKFLRYANDELNKNLTCQFMVHEEEAIILNKMTQNCAEEIPNLIEERQKEILKKLEKSENQILKEIENFDKSIEKVLEKY